MSKARRIANASSSEVGTTTPVGVSTSEVGLDKLTLELYLEKADVNPGLVASYRYEAQDKPAMLEKKTEDDWDEALKNQSKRIYNY